MNSPTPIPDVFWSLLNAACDGSLAADQMQELESILASNAEACKLFADHFQLKTDIRFLGRVARVRDIGLAGIRSTFPETPPTVSSSPVASSPGLGFLASAYHGTVGFFSQEIPFSLLIATLVTGLGLLAGSLVHVSRSEQQIVKKSPSTPVFQLAQDSTLQVVGRITGMVDCRWSKDARVPSGYDNVLLGRTFKLDAGLVEITYNTGAKVILQGPCTYEVESRDGGYLSLGKLTAKLDKKPSAISGQQAGKVAIEATPKSPNPQISKSSLSAIRYSLFTIKTPTAIVTDLGTEFGVEVAKGGTTTSHVFRGSVRFQALSSGGKTADEGQILRENQSARAANRQGSSNGDKIVTVFVTPVEAADFVREIPNVVAKPSSRVVVVAHWRFDGNQFLADSSGNGHTLVNRGVVQVDDAASFNGNAMLSSADSVDLTPYSKVRISWSQKVTPPILNHVIWEHGPNYNLVPGAFIAYLDKEEGMAAIRASDESLSYNLDEFPMVAGVWETFTVEYNLTTDRGDRSAYRTSVVKVFKGGMLIGTGSTYLGKDSAMDGMPPDSFINSAFHIGGRAEPETTIPRAPYFVGQIDDVKIEGTLRLKPVTAKIPEGKTP